MRIAVIGTHFIGKTTLVKDFIKDHPNYKHEVEPYYQLELALEPDLDSFLEQLNYSIEMLTTNSNERDIIFDRCPVDFIAYSMSILEKEYIDINDSEVSDRFFEVKEALNNLD